MRRKRKESELALAAVDSTMLLTCGELCGVFCACCDGVSGNCEIEREA